ncbi:MAG TPA: DotI/IcmL/TraM family protein [Gammaproteobacteria bacterium]|nr:DotI/IcmL/TraM family protein [Gammaproteobacteria bacterium]
MKTEGEAMLDDALVRVHLRNAFYREKFRFVLLIYLLSLVANVFLLGIIFYLMRHPTEPLYFAADRIGRLIRVFPVHEPNMSTADVSNWTVEAIEASYSYDFVNYRAQLQSAQKYYTDYSWRSYMKALAASNNIKALTERKFIIIAKVVEPPKLLKQGLLQGAQTWKFQIPVLVTYLMPPFNEKSKFSNPLIFTVVVQRQNVLDSHKGLAIIRAVSNIVVGPQPG